MMMSHSSAIFSSEENRSAPSFSSGGFSLFFCGLGFWWGCFGCFVGCQLHPGNTALIMGDINAMHFIVAGHTDPISFLTITGFPTIGIRTNEKPIKPGREYGNDTNSKYCT